MRMNSKVMQPSLLNSGEVLCCFSKTLEGSITMSLLEGPAPQKSYADERRLFSELSNVLD